MKIAVISEGDSLESYVGEDFGHAPYILIVDSETLDYTVIANEFVNSVSGAGMQVAGAIASLKVDAVITGGIGSHGLDILQKANIHVAYDEEGTVEECVENLKRRMEFRKKFESN